MTIEQKRQKIIDYVISVKAVEFWGLKSLINKDDLFLSALDGTKVSDRITEAVIENRSFEKNVNFNDLKEPVLDEVIQIIDKEIKTFKNCKN